MKVNLGTVEVTDEQRKALNSHFGRPGMATREDVRGFYTMSCIWDDVMYDYQNKIDRSTKKTDDQA